MLVCVSSESDSLCRSRGALAKPAAPTMLKASWRAICDVVGVVVVDVQAARGQPGARLNQIVPQSEAFVPFVPSVVPSMPSMPVGTCPFMPFVPFGTEVRTVQPVVRASSPRLPAFQGPCTPRQLCELVMASCSIYKCKETLIQWTVCGRSTIQACYIS